MPPKKKGKGKKGKKGKKKDPTALEAEEKMARVEKEKSALKDQLINRRDLTRRAIAARDEMVLERERSQKEFEDFKMDAKDVNAYMSKQYKTMQTQMGMEIGQLESQLAATRRQLEETQNQLEKTNNEFEKTVREKDQKIQELEVQKDYLHMTYQNLLMNTLDDLTTKLKDEWELYEGHATKVHSHYKNALLDFGINPNQV